MLQIMQQQQMTMTQQQVMRNMQANVVVGANGIQVSDLERRITEELSPRLAGPMMPGGMYSPAIHGPQPFRPIPMAGPMPMHM